MADKYSIDKNDVLHHEDIQDVAAAKEEAHFQGVLTPEEKIIEKKLRRKIDSLVMPMVVTVYLMNYIDRNNYAAAKLQGLQEDLNLSDTQYQLGLSILFVGYVSIAERSS
jgi:sugar phosphate permease